MARLENWAPADITLVLTIFAGTSQSMIIAEILLILYQLEEKGAWLYFRIFEL